jgi:hypothetical protein
MEDLLHLDFAPISWWVNHTAPINTDPHYCKELPSKIDYERLSPYFAFSPHDVIHNTLRQTPQLAKSTIPYPMRLHLNSCFQMLRHKRLNEGVATDTYLASDKSIEGYYCSQVYFTWHLKVYLLQ